MKSTATCGKRVLLAVALLTAVGGCKTQDEVDVTAEEAAIRRTDDGWLAAAKSHDLERVLRFWSDDAAILPAGAPAIIGKDAIRRYVANAFATPGFSITWKTEKVEVARSGEIAYSTGTDLISVTSPDGKTITQENRGVVIWKKQPDGSWKCVLDIMSPSGSAGAK